MTTKLNDIDASFDLVVKGIALDLQESLKDKLTLRHGVDTGLGKSGIKAISDGNMITVEIPEHLKYVEYGTPPHMPPVEELEGWARRKLGDKKLAFALALHIKKYGTKSYPFIRETFNNDLPDIVLNNFVEVLG